MNRNGDQQTPGPSTCNRLSVKRDRDNLTEIKSDETNTDSPISTLYRVFTILVHCLEPDYVLDNLLELGFPAITIRDIREVRHTSDRNRALIKAIQPLGNDAYHKFKKSLQTSGQGMICTLLEKTEKDENTSDLQRELFEQSREKMKRKQEDKNLRTDLKDDLITNYREHESVIPASPLVDEHYVPIEELYVLPPMWAYNNSYFGPGKDRQHGGKTSGNVEQIKQEITISELFLSGDVRYRKIYVTANAGFGKTSLSQKLTMAWCQSHLPLTSLTQNYEGEELSAMKYFDFLFLLHLRDYQSEQKCNLDDLIMQMVSEKLSRNTQYTKNFVQRILHKKKCIIILDGLDEWAHPGFCTRKPEVPHNNHPGSCTVLTTTRDWKIGTIGLSPKRYGSTRGNIDAL